MKIRCLPQLGFVVISLMLCSANCDKLPDFGARPGSLPKSTYVLNGTSFTGQGNYNKTLGAIETFCDNNNTIRLYYSPLADFTSTDTLYTVVSSSKAGSLAAKECYLEVSTSTSDTWLSTGSGSTMVKLSRIQDAIGYYYKFTLTDAALQHWTSVPLNEFGKVSADLITLRK